MQVWRKCVFMHQQVEGQPSKKPKKQSGQGGVAFLENSRQSGCVFQDVEPPTFISIFKEEYNSFETNSHQ